VAVEKDKRNIPSSVQLREKLQEKEKALHFKDDIFGMTLLTNPGYISSSRNIMFTSHLRQFVNLTNPDFPKVFTNYENIVGKYSTGYYQAKEELQVIDKISRFQNGVNDAHSYLLFTYDKKNDRYDVIFKKNVEDLTEKFGFVYNNKNMDSKHVGDVVDKGEVLYKTTSYDDNMNYCYGKNAKFVYMLENNTIEDAIMVREGFSKDMISKEIETVKVSLNDNDILCNLYGDTDGYKCFPNIGEYVKDKIVCAKRRIHNTQLLFDVKKSNLRKINFSSDVLSFCDGQIVDITIYSNKTLEEIEDNTFNAQIKGYLKMQHAFYEQVLNRCEQIINSGSNYSNDINYYYKKARDILNPDYKWREEDNSVFSNMIIEFVIQRDIPLSVGQKITGRYGNKGVISKIVPDDEMPFLETGERVDIIFNTLGVINRLNSQQLFEQSITFIGNRVKERLVTLATMEEKEHLLLRMVWYFNKEQEKKLKKYLNGLSGLEKGMFFKSIEDQGIFIHIPPLWEKEPLFDRIRDLYKEFDWIKPYDVFVNKFGRKIKILKPLVVGDMYVIKLKQTSKKGFSVRSTGSLSKKGIPEKSNKAKTHQELYSKTPIRIGDQENVNSAIGVPTEIIAQLHLFYRSSVIGRRDIGEKLATSIKEIKDFEYSPEFTNRNVEILQAYLKAMGVRIVFSDQNMNINIYTDEMRDHDIGDKMYICTQEEYEELMREQNIRDEYKENTVFVGTPDEFEEQIKKDVEWSKRVDGKLVIDVNI
jgi:DNA-directed RNA polymerase beta subunit